MDMTQQKRLLRAILNRTNQPNTFAAHSGIRITAVGDGWAEGVLTAGEGSMNPMGVVHGGCLVTLMDHAAGTAATTHGSTCLTINCQIRFMNAARAGQLHVRAEVIRWGGSLAVVQASVTDSGGVPCAEGNYTFRLKQNAFPIEEWLDEGE